MPRSAVITVVGVLMWFLGGFIAFLGFIYEASYAISGSNGGGVIMGGFGAIVVLVGVIMVLVGVYRAMSKIDALPVPVPNQMSVTGPNVGSDDAGSDNPTPAQPPFRP